jgi:hypothetical protein
VDLHVVLESTGTAFTEREMKPKWTTTTHYHYLILAMQVSLLSTFAHPSPSE